MLSSRLHADPGSVRAVTPGVHVPRPTGVDALEATDGRRIPIAGASFDAPIAAGTYFFIQGARRVGALVVNPEVSESQLARWSKGELKDRVASGNVRVTDNRDEWVRLAFTGAARRSLVAPMLIAALLVLGMETVLAATGGGAGGGTARQT